MRLEAATIGVGASPPKLQFRAGVIHFLEIPSTDTSRVQMFSGIPPDVHE